MPPVTAGAAPHPASMSVPWSQPHARGAGSEQGAGSRAAAAGPAGAPPLARGPPSPWQLHRELLEVSRAALEAEARHEEQLALLQRQQQTEAIRAELEGRKALAVLQIERDATRQLVHLVSKSRARMDAVRRKFQERRLALQAREKAATAPAPPPTWRLAAPPATQLPSPRRAGPVAAPREAPRQPRGVSYTPTPLLSRPILGPGTSRKPTTPVVQKFAELCGTLPALAAARAPSAPRAAVAAEASTRPPSAVPARRAAAPLLRNASADAVLQAAPPRTPRSSAPRLPGAAPSTRASTRAALPLVGAPLSPRSVGSLCVSAQAGWVDRPRFDALGSTSSSPRFGAEEERGAACAALAAASPRAPLGRGPPADCGGGAAPPWVPVDVPGPPILQDPAGGFWHWVSESDGDPAEPEGDVAPCAFGHLVPESRTAAAPSPYPDSACDGDLSPRYPASRECTF
ncbi:unnamed protein product [Prorocentrum cordatum]|uniref:Uncharacterized protein n=1 Tax=Prorocentrum cordatum TaxID=2364126 RepID=A0ABN9V6U1_9DINO|nr:unnamed protein product [Polarella glacialis]